LRFFSSSDAPFSTRLSEKARAQLKNDMQRLENLASSPAAKKNQDYPTNR
jgi:hypothetical protein